METYSDGRSKAYRKTINDKNNPRGNAISAIAKKNGITRAEATRIYDAQHGGQPATAPPPAHDARNPVLPPPGWSLPRQERVRDRTERAAPERKATFSEPAPVRGSPYVGWGEGDTHQGLFTIGCSGTGQRDHNRDVENYRQIEGPVFEDKYAAEKVLQYHFRHYHKWSEWFHGDEAFRQNIIDHILFSDWYREAVLAYIKERNGS